jgi:methylenetetrahydrofolate reductase (NADPH)
LSLLEALDEAGHGLTEIGIPCYPEGHPSISDELLLQALRDKSRFAAYMTTQICFDPDTIRSWVKSMRAEGIDLPVHLGLPGVAPVHKLIAISARIGIGNSVRFLSKNTNLVGKLVRPGGYAPDVLILSLASTFVDPDAAIAGFHFYTFNQTKSTGKWRVDFEAELDRLIAEGVTP